MAKSIAYLIPEFPGQTHAFFMREIRAIEDLDFKVELLSTQLPAQSLIVHSWSKEAMQRTRYLHPIGFRAVPSTLWELARSGPGGWWKCLASIFRAEGLSAKGRARLVGLLVMGARASALARAAGFSHIHAHSCADSAHIAMFYSLLSGGTYSMTLHGPLSDYGPNQAEKWRHADFAIVITRKILDEVRAVLGPAVPRKVAVAPMGVEADVFRRRGPYSPWDRSGPCKIFSCARLNPVKGHNDLIRAVGLLVERGIDAHLNIAGASDSSAQEYRMGLERLIEELGLAGRVRLLGAVSEEVVKGELAACHLFALASWFEPLGVVFMEAMSMEAPVVATGEGGVRELIDDGVEGILVPPRDPVSLADAMERVLTDPHLASRLGQAGRLRVMNEFHSGVSALTIARFLGSKEGVPATA